MIPLVILSTIFAWCLLALGATREGWAQHRHGSGSTAVLWLLAVSKLELAPLSHALSVMVGMDVPCPFFNRSDSASQCAHLRSTRDLTHPRRSPGQDTLMLRVFPLVRQSLSGANRESRIATATADETRRQHARPWFRLEALR